MNTTTNPNGRERKTLASQIDRLNVMLDGLADGLNDAVAQAVQGAVALAVKEAVQAVLTEILTNPAVLAKLQTAQPAQEQPAEAPAPKGPGRLAAWRNWIGTKLKKVSERCRDGWQRACDASVALGQRAARVVSTMATAVREEAMRVVATGWFGELSPALGRRVRLGCRRPPCALLHRVRRWPRRRVTRAPLLLSGGPRGCLAAASAGVAAMVGSASFGLPGGVNGVWR